MKLLILFLRKKSEMKKLMFIFGTRPEFIKVYPVIIEAQQAGNGVVVVNTGQHKEMLEQLVSQFNCPIDYDLQIMDDCQSLSDIVALSIKRLDPIIKEQQPDIVFVHGDTAATLAGSLCAFYNHIKIAHIEAGLRTNNIHSPFPEEVNRQMVSIVSEYHFAPTVESMQNLLLEGCEPSKIHVVGNTAIDMLKYTIQKQFTHPLLAMIGDYEYILITAHRRENLQVLKNIFKAINSLAAEYRNKYKFVYPIHLNPQIREIAAKTLTADNLIICEPLETISFHNIMARAKLVLTDSGGIQEEAPSLGKPVLVLRDTTERPEGVKAGTLKLIGTNCEQIFLQTKELLDNQEKYEQMSTVQNPYGDGTSASQIIKVINE